MLSFSDRTPKNSYNVNIFHAGEMSLIFFLLAENLAYSAVFQSWQIEDPTSASWLGGKTKPWMHISCGNSLLLEIRKYFLKLLITWGLYRKEHNSLALFLFLNSCFLAVAGHKVLGWKDLGFSSVWLLVLLWLELCLILVGEGGPRQMIPLGTEVEWLRKSDEGGHPWLLKWGLIAAVQQTLLLFNTCHRLKSPLILRS